MNNSRKVNIVTVTYNSEKHLRDTLLSVRNQTYENLTHYIIDGLSTDSTLDIIKEFYNEKMILISEPDNGIYDAMNKAIRMIDDEDSYIIFMNSDDYFYSNSVVEDVIKSYDSYDLIYGNTCLIDDGKNKVVGKEIEYKDFVDGNICHQSVFTKKKAFDLLGEYDSNLKIVADYKFHLNVFKNSDLKVKYVPKTISCIRLGGVSSVEITRHRDERLQVIKDNFNSTKYIKAIIKYHMIDLKIYLKRILKSIGFFELVKRMRSPIKK